MDALRVKELLETALGARVTALAPMPVGFGLTGFKVDLADGRRLAVKARQVSARVDLRLEGYMLGELARHSTLPVPAVHLSEPDLLVMDFIETDGGGITPQVERHAAELIAALHAVPRPSFGYERDTLIGPLPQPNPQMDRWIPFFRDHRLLAMARAAQAEGRLPAKLLMRLERLAERLDTYLPSHATQACCTAICGLETCWCAGNELPASSIPQFIADTQRSSSPSPPCSGRSGRPSSRPMRLCSLWSPAFTSCGQRSTSSTRRSCM